MERSVQTLQTKVRPAAPVPVRVVGRAWQTWLLRLDWQQQERVLESWGSRTEPSLPFRQRRVREELKEVPKTGDRTECTPPFPMPSLSRMEPVLHVVSTRDKRVKVDMDPKETVTLRVPGV